MPKYVLMLDGGRICAKCGVFKETNQFRPNPKLRCGLDSYCKDCVSANAKEKRKRNPELARAKDKISRLRVKVTERTHELRRKWTKDWRQKNQHKRRVYARVKWALMTGKMKRLPCERCDATAEAHHDDYTKPLDVTWLSKIHHQERHRELRGEA